MNFETADLHDCGHVGQLAGVCQYAAPNEQGCANKICEQCIGTCDICRAVLCPHHAVRLEDGTQVYCSDHVNGYIARTLLSALLDR
ncbi:hypothetical protein [Halorarum salinum]|uniref:4Fe-4S ferredoxin-type domain-containing protein n=1 Tax=Halorarum salinum TaxID=2743089 RepID=A0A7D5LAI5_9EURY|nr:hypothetical protein [Halobaculum salinum]QLG61948.1 hypothetical protein HUG12_09545 [Halobaculum salinum]